MNVGFVVFDKLTQLDFTGPFEVLARVPGWTCHVVAESVDPVVSDTGLSILPTCTLETCPSLDVVFVPGGPGQTEAMLREPLVAFLRRQGRDAQWVTSACTGSLLLGAAGLLQGYAATSHWSCVEQLTAFGAEPRTDRVVRDRNRLTGGGVTAGIDMALTLVSEAVDPVLAMAIQLGLEYAPAPPLCAGRPETAPDAIVQAVRQANAVGWERREQTSAMAARRLGPHGTPGLAPESSGR